MATPTQVRRIVVKVDTQGDSSLKRIAAGFAQLNRSIGQTTSAITKLQNIFLALQGAQLFGFSLGNLVQALDTVQKLQTRLESLSGSAEAAQKTFAGIVQVANDNFTAISDLGVVYNRLGNAIKDTGASAAGTLAVADTLQKSFRLFGATAAEATGATIQLSQGIASGQIRGQELRSVLEANAVIGDLLAKRLGTTRGELLRFSEKRGGISAVEFFEALASGAKDLNEQASRLRPTISEGLTKNINLLQERLAELNTKFGLTEKAVTAIDAAFKNLDKILLVVGGLLAKAAISASINGIAVAVSAMSAALLKLAASPAIGFLVNLGTVAITAIGTLAGWPAVIAAAVVSLSGFFAVTKTGNDIITYFTDTLDRFINNSTRSERELRRLGKAAQFKEPVIGLGQAFTDLDVAVAKTFDTFKNGAKSITGESIQPLSELDKLANTAKYAQGSKDVFNFQVSLAKLNEEYGNTKNLKKYSEDLKNLQIEKITREQKAGTLTVFEYNKQLRDIQLGKLINNSREAFYEVRKLNEQFAKDGDVRKFAEGLRKVNEARIAADVKQGRTDALTANIERNKIAVERLNEEYSKGKTTIDSYNFSVNQIRIQELNEQFKAGKLAVDQYYASLVKLQDIGLGESFKAGLSQYLSSAGTFASNFANVVDNSFKRLEDSVFEFVKTGKFNFNQFTQAVLDDLLKIIIRAQIIAPLARGLLNSGGGSTGGTDLALNYVPGGSEAYAAKGMAFNGASNYFANGGIVNGRSSFLYGSGMRGIMGEAGPEAIIPLKRDASGELGISGSGSNVTVNVINQANNTEVQQSERTDETGARILDVIIVSKVKEGMAKGLFDKQFETQFGLRRRGV